MVHVHLSALSGAEQIAGSRKNIRLKTYLKNLMYMYMFLSRRSSAPQVKRASKGPVSVGIFSSSGSFSFFVLRRFFTSNKAKGAESQALAFMRLGPLRSIKGDVFPASFGELLRSGSNLLAVRLTFGFGGFGVLRIEFTLVLKIHSGGCPLQKL